MDSKLRKRRVRIPTPFNMRLELFVQDHKITLIFLLLVFGFVTFYLFGLDMYWKFTYTRAGFGYLFQ